MSGLAARLGHDIIRRMPRLLVCNANTTEAVTQACERCAAEGAEAVVMGAPQWQVPRPLLDGIACAVVLAEALVRLNLPRASLGTLVRPKRESVGLSAPLAALLAGKA